MADITPIIATQDTEQTTSSQTLVDANCETGVLADGVDYLVIHCGNHGGNDTSTVTEAVLLFGSTTIGYSAAEGKGDDIHSDSGQLNGFKRITGNGSDTLKIQFRCITSSDTAYIGAMQIIAIPLTELTENTDFWHSGTNSDSLEVENASSSWEPLRTTSGLNWTLPETGDYLILMSAEGRPDSTSGSESAMLRALADGTYICQTDSSTMGWLEESEDVADWNNISCCTMETISSGVRVFALECGSETSTADFRRSNIWVFKKSAFVQIVQNKFSSGLNTSSTSYVDWTASNQAINPTKTSYVVALGYAVGMNSSFYSPNIELYNATDTTEHRIDSGEYCNDYGTSTTDRVATFMAHCGQYSSGSDTWRFRIRSNAGGTSYWGRSIGDAGDIQSNLILWQLTTAEAPAAKREELFYSRVA